ncbi:centrosome and spindle pole associated protein 1-like [Haliotis asinina]|uniref:centrosome and spindle pole associated protein 1-like n=1 Tax=Haliotis asinina TaxID=109174 RepID=UPI0035323787
MYETTTTHYSGYRPGGHYLTSLDVGEYGERASAKKRRQNLYKEDLQLQMAERNAAKQRERIQDMSVNASGYLDPEKGPERLKPLGGTDWTQYRSRWDSRVRPYHTLFLYDENKRPRAPPPVVVHGSISPSPTVTVPVRVVPQASSPVRRVIWQGSPRTARVDYSPRPMSLPSYSEPRARPREPIVSSEKPNLGTLDPPHRLNFTAPVPAPAPLSYRAPMDSGYGIMAARDISLVPQVPLVQPLQPIHYPDTRPIIIQQPAPAIPWQGPKYNPIQLEVPVKSSALLPEPKYRAAIDKPLDDLNDKLEEARLKIKLERDNEEHKRRLQRELDENQRRLRDSEAEARRRLEELRLESENRRREAERQRREWERLMRLKELERPRSIPTVVVKPGSGRNRLLDDMDLYRQKLREERRMIEELLMNRRPIEPGKLDIKVVRKNKERQVDIPPTPKTDDNANPENVHVFTDLKHRDYRSRREFRSIFPEVPYTNMKLEWQQGALLKQQEEALRALRGAKTDSEKQVIMKKYFFTRPVWMDREITPFARTRKYRGCGTSVDIESRLGRIDEVSDGLRFRDHRPSSADTLNDDTWLRPSSADV